MNKRLGVSLALTIMVTALAMVAAPADQAASGAKKLDSCSLLTKEEIQAVVGKPTEAGKPNTRANTAGGSLCDFKIGDYGSMNLLTMVAGSGNNYAATLAGLKKLGTKTEDAPGIGDHSFFAFPGYGMLQLNTWKGPYYLIITLIVPGATEAQEKPMAAQLMGKILPKL